MDEFNAAMKAGTTTVVQYWMNWMLLVFASSLFFIRKHNPARIVLMVFILTLPIGWTIWLLSKNVHLLGIAHLILWLPLLVYLYTRVIKNNEYKIKTTYGVWVVLLVVTILISLIFDIRDVFLVFTGAK